MSNLVSRISSGRLMRVLAPAALLLILQNGLFASESARAGPLTAAPEPASLLFVQTAGRGRLSRGAHGGLTLTLKASRWTQSFTDRPRRASQVERTRTFVNEWGQRGFRSDPPNAALSIDRADGKVFTIELSHPRLSNGWLSYSVRRLKGSAKLRLGTFGTASLFIDDANEKWCFSMTFGPAPCAATKTQIVVFQVPQWWYGSFTVSLASSVAEFSPNQPSGGYCGSTYNTPNSVTVSCASIGYQWTRYVPVTIESSPYGPQSGTFTLTTSMPAQVAPDNYTYSPIGPSTPVTYQLW
ncbi:MAG: hypothetical protein ACR2L9_05935 [Solirubrobacteraceae bacterium]